MPVLPLVGSMIVVSWLDLAVALAGVDHGHADAVLDRPERIEVLQLGDDGRLGVADHAAQPDQRRVADGLGDVVVNAAAEGRLLPHGRLLVLGPWKREGAIVGRRIVAEVIVFLGRFPARHGTEDDAGADAYNTSNGSRSPRATGRHRPPDAGTETAPHASVFYELMSDALVWSDEIPDLDTGDVRDFHCLRFVFRYRTTLMLGVPDGRFHSVWEEGA